MKNILFVFIILPVIFFSGAARAQEAPADVAPLSFGSSDQVFEAKVLEVLEQKQLTREDGSVVIQQNLRLRGLTDNWKDKEVISHGVGDIDVVSGVVASAGDKVLVSYSRRVDGTENFYVTDFVRRGWLSLLTILFSLLIVVVGKKQGIKSLLSLIVTFIIIMKFIIPRIEMGSDPLTISIIGSVFILAIIIYLTWGFSRKAHIGMVSILVSLVITGLISILFSKVTELSGASDENVMFLIGLTKTAINFKGLLLAGIVLGVVGVLDDVVISQVSAVEQLKIANSDLSTSELFRRGMTVGVDHISSMTNTLFLAYAGASLPLLLLFSLKTEPFMSFSQVINNETMATEIVRTFTGSIGLILSMPITTLIAARFFGAKNVQPKETKILRHH